MKRIFCVFLILSLLAGCSPVDTVSDADIKQDYTTGVWLSFLELDNMLKRDFKTEFNAAIENCKSRGITDIFVHVRPFCDSYYPSKLFPLRPSVSMLDFDVLEYMIKACHQNNIKFHAWINPYRIKTSDSEILSLPDLSLAKRWLTDDSSENDINISTISGVYLNPASIEVRALIIESIREIIDNYKVDGIHFDDYFYPTTDPSFDERSYLLYQETTPNPLSLEDWRRANINTLISGVYTAIKFKDKNIIFSISPSASIEDNYNNQYADVYAWIDNNCVDYIIPQIYFGFEYPDSDYNFDNLVSNWKDTVNGSNTKLIIGLATYKINTAIEPDCDEWKNGVGIIKKQVEMCKEGKNIYGHVFFSYDSLCEYL